MEQIRGNIMGIKKTVHAICLKTRITRRIYHALSWVKGWMYYARVLAWPIYRYRRVSEKPIFLVFTPQHANLGDHAIAYVEKKVLDDLNLVFFEITGEQLRILNYYKMLNILDKAMILINGGGNIGTFWPDIENLNRKIVMKNPNATIMVLPNTMYYGQTIDEQKELELSKKIYNAHSKLFFYARESISYAEMKKSFNNVKLIPDVVLSLNYSNIGAARSGAIVCLRNDIEATLSNDEKEHVEIISRRMFGERVTKSNTVLAYNVSVADREKELNKKIEEFATAQLVITDRLHGMVFCAITGTNCIVLNSKSPKMRGCYEWIKHLDYIRMVDDVENIEGEYEKLKSEKNVYDNTEILKKMNELKKDIINVYLNM